MMKKPLPLLLSLLLTTALLTGCAGTAPATPAAAPTSAPTNVPTEAPTEAPTAAPAAGLTIDLAGITEEISFIDCSAGGTAMQLILRKETDGTPHLAFNTCQVCSGSPYAFFAVSGGRLVCQNCGNSFSYDAVGQSAYGCMPMKLSDFTVTDGVITIDAVLEDAAPQFKNWKKGL